MTDTVRAAVAAARRWASITPTQRAGELEAVADALDARREELVPLADERPTSVRRG